MVWFNYASTHGKFWIVWPAALAGAFVTYIFIADTTGMDLAEAVRPLSPGPLSMHDANWIITTTGLRQ